MKYTKILRNAALSAVATLFLLGGSSCERRELWVFGDEFPQIVLNVDWRNYDRDAQLYPHTPDPSGMTVWFYPTDGRKAYTYTTDQVLRFETYLGAGLYRALVIDYSPLEYGHQEFIGMDYVSTAEVQATPYSYQSNGSEPELFGPNAFAGPGSIPTQANGHYTISWEPEIMASDTVAMTVKSGKYDKYIPYKERDEYQATLVKQDFYAEPLIIPWRLRICIPIKGLYYLYKVEGSIAGLADGYMLAEDHNSDDPCLIQLDDDWKVEKTGDNTGYIAKTIYTWGLRHSQWVSGYENLKPESICSTGPANNIRINLKFTLRDRQTVVYGHYDVGDVVTLYHNDNNPRALRIDLRDSYNGGETLPDLPFVEAYNGVGLDAFVQPWEDGANSEVEF
jgi:hypothetical protein